MYYNCNRFFEDPIISESELSSLDISRSSSSSSLEVTFISNSDDDNEDYSIMNFKSESSSSDKVECSEANKSDEEENSDDTNLSTYAALSSVDRKCIFICFCE